MVKSFAKRWWYLLILGFLGTRVQTYVSREDWLTVGSLLLAVLGMGMNVLVIILNDGMPASASNEEIPADERSNYRPIDESTQLSILADWITVRDFLISPGDVLIAIGMTGIILIAMLR